MTSRWWVVLWSVAALALFTGVVGAVACGFWMGSQDCHAWVTSHGYQLVSNEWWAKTQGCVAKTIDGVQVQHTETLAGKASGWLWQFAIFAAGAVPAVILIVIASARR